MQKQGKLRIYTLVTIVSLVTLAGICLVRQESNQMEKPVGLGPGEPAALARRQSNMGFLANSSCCESSEGISLEVLCNRSVPVGTVEQCTCVDYMYCRLVVLGAISSNHFQEAQDMIATVQMHLPHTKLIIYDLGLTENQHEDVSSYCNVELRMFPFENYPPYFKHLRVFAWKPVMVSSVAQEYEVILYGDASLRLCGSVQEMLLPLLREFPFSPGPTSPRPFVTMTREGMLDYLQFNLSRKEGFETLPRAMQGGIFIIWANKMMMDKFLNNWADCAIHEKCIDPKNEQDSRCKWDLLQSNPGAYIGCHRFDQAALNVILYREFGTKVWWSVQHDSNKVWQIRKGRSYLYNVTRCTK